MAIVPKYPKRVTFPYDLPNSLPGEKILCLREDEVQILLGYASLFPFWATTWIKDEFIEYYETPNAEEMDAISDFCGDLVYKLQEGDFMLCESLESLISALTLAIQNQSSCCCGSSGSGSGGSGSTDSPGDEQPTIDNGEDSPPDGFDDWSEFKAHQCAVAQKIIDDLKRDLSAMTTLSLIGVTIAGLAPVITAMVVTPIPGDAIITIAAVIIAAFTIGDLVTDDAYNVISNNEDSLLCALYTGLSATDSASRFKTEFYEQAQAELATGVQAWSAYQLINAMLSFDSVNRMVNPFLGYTPPAGDCSGCAVCAGAILNTSESIVNGANLAYNLSGNYVTVQAIERSLAGGTYWVVEFLFNNETGLYNVSDHCGPQVIITDYEITAGSLTAGGISQLALLDDDRTVLHSDSDWLLPEFGTETRGFTILSTTSFSVRVNVETFSP